MESLVEKILRMKQIYIRILTDENLGDESLVTGFLEEWFSKHIYLAPERYSHGEPVNKVVDPQNLSEIALEWQIPPSLMFKRISHPKYLLDIKWRKNKGLDQRPYPWGASIWLNYSQGQKHALIFFEFLIKWFNPAFGYVTLYSDESYKHYEALIPQYRNGQYLGKATSNWGGDIGDTIPGIYWLTYLSTKILSEDVLHSLEDVTLKKNKNLGRIINPYQCIDMIGTEQAKELEKRIAERLDPVKVFDLDSFIYENTGERIIRD